MRKISITFSAVVSLEQKQYLCMRGERLVCLYTQRLKVIDDSSLTAGTQVSCHVHNVVFAA